MTPDRLPPDLASLVQELRDEAKARYQEELRTIERTLAVLLKSRLRKNVPVSDDESDTHSDRIRSFLAKHPGKPFASARIARETGLDVEAVRTALKKTKPNPFEKVHVAPRRVRWRLKGTKP